MKKKTWEKPNLIILSRGRPEEAVLQACKARTLRGPFAQWGFQNVPCRIGGNTCSAHSNT